MQFVQQDISNLLTIAFRLNWQREVWVKGGISDALWMFFAAADIDLFHVEFRSLFDYLAMLFVDISLGYNNQKYANSFEKLRNWIGKSKNNVQLIGEELALTITSCNWFNDLREMRNANIHKGQMTVVFPEKGRILFTAVENISSQIAIPEFIFIEENVLDFEIYAGLYIGRLISFLEESATVIRNKLNLQNDVEGGFEHMGLWTASTWIDLAFRKLCGK